MRQHHGGGTDRPGFTLVEVLVAVVLIDVGLLALVASSAVLVRRANAVRARSAATQLAVNRLQRLGAQSCGPAGGAATSGIFAEDWTSTIVITGVREVRDSVWYDVDGRRRSVVLRTRLGC